MQGPNEFVVTGTFKDWDRWKDLSKIEVPTLVIGARYDEMNPDDIRKMGTPPSELPRRRSARTAATSPCGTTRRRTSRP